MRGKSERRGGLASVAILAMLALGSVSIVSANRSGTFDFSGTWSISYFLSDCTTPWSSYAVDGSGIGSTNTSPVVNSGGTICVKVSVTGANSGDNGKKVWYTAGSITTSTSLPVLLFTISGGAGAGMVKLTNVNFANPNLCLTAPEKIAEMSSGTPKRGDFDGHIADHFINGGASGNPCGTCTATLTSTSTVTSTTTKTSTSTVTTTQTHTATVTTTNTGTVTQSTTVTQTNTATATETQTSTATVTATQTQTQTNTATATESQTVTQTVTETSTQTVTVYPHTTTVTVTQLGQAPRNGLSPVGSLRAHTSTSSTTTGTSASCSSTTTTTKVTTKTVPTTTTTYVTTTTTVPTTVTTTVGTTTQVTASTTVTTTVGTTVTVTTTIPVTTTATATATVTKTVTVTTTLQGTTTVTVTLTTQTTVESDTSTTVTTTIHEVPDFPLGLLPAMLASIPVLMLLRKFGPRRNS